MIPLIFLLIEDESDRAFMERVYTQYHRLMYAQALSILGSGDAAEDAVSDAIVKLIEKIDLLRSFDCKKLRSYAVITVRHAAITQYNRGKRQSAFPNDQLEEWPGSESAEEPLLAKAGVERIQEAIRRLPPREKELMLMKYFRELTDVEIARETGLKPVSVRVHLSRARGRLAELLGGGKEGQT